MNEWDGPMAAGSSYRGQMRPMETVDYDAPRRAMIAAGMEELALQVDLLDKAFSVLYDRLAPVLRPHPPTEAVNPDAKRATEDSEIAEGIRRRIDQIIRTRQNLEATAARVDL